MKTLINFRHGIAAALAAAALAYCGHPEAAFTAWVSAMLLFGLDWMHMNMGAEQ